MKGVVSMSCCRYVVIALLIRSAIALLHIYSHTQIDCCKLVLQATGTDAVLGINLWMPQPFPYNRDTQLLNKEGRGVLHGERVKDAAKNIDFFCIQQVLLNFHGFMECKDSRI
jgi:hypothetical protein